MNRFILASSISAYEWYPATKFNPPDYMPVDENHPCRPQDIYSTTKRMQEELSLTYYYQYSLPVTVLRLTAVIGPYGRGGGRGWRKFAEQLGEGVRVEIPHLSAEEPLPLCRLPGCRPHAYYRRRTSGCCRSNL